MHIPAPGLLAIVFGASEAALAILKRSRDDSVDADRRSLRVLWITNLVAVTAGVFVAASLPQARIAGGALVYWTGIALFALGLVLRWYSIIYLGRYFTVNVAIHSRHEIIDTGPYRRIRHPSYTGALLAFLGIALCLDNWAALAVIALPVAWAFLRRMRIEENALSSAIGNPYRDYMQRTKRLLPFIY